MYKLREIKSSAQNEACPPNIGRLSGEAGKLRR
jgi:hypothetical protein